MDILPDNFFTYHLSVAFPKFASSRPKHIEEVLNNFNIIGLLTHLFSPYKRMALSGKVSLSERLSYNLISALVGAMVRIGLIIAGILATILVIIFDFFATIFYLVIPVFSYMEYSQLVDNYITKTDLATNNNLIAKLAKTKICAALCTFFDNEFRDLFTKMPDATSLGVKIGQKSYEPFLTLAENWPDLKKYLAAKSIKEADFKLLVTYLNDLVTAKSSINTQPLGQALIYGYTNNLDQFGTELTAKSHPPFYGKKEMLTKIEKVLCREQNNNLILVGEPGVGKHSILDALAGAITKGELESLRDKRLILLDIVALLGSSKNAAEVQGNFESLLSEAKSAGNIILSIDEIDRITTSQDGRTDLADVLSTMLTDNNLPILGLCSIDSFNQYVRTNSSINSLFDRIDIEEPTREELITILIGKTVPLTQKEKISTSFNALLEIIEKSNRLMMDKKQPEKSILFLEDAISQAKRKKLKQLDVTTVDEVISEKTKTPVGKITENEAEKLTDLETILHKRIVGQNEAINEIAKAMRRARAELDKSTKPMGSFMFLGPTGVGKTETAKALAQSYFGDEKNMVRFDMTEFQGDDALSRLIGNPNTKSPGQLATQIRENPFGILLIDEFEKAGHDVQNLFLQILDEGNLTDAFGKKISFNNIIIIATSNAAAEFIREEVEKNTPDLSKKIIDFVLSKGLFSPELINRFDATIVFKPLSREEVVQVAFLMLESLAKQIKGSKNITLEITPDIAQLVAQQGYVVAFGARPIKRLIQDKIEDQIAKLIISGKLKNGDTVQSQTLLSFLS